MTDPLAQDPPTGTLRLVEYDDAWPARFAREAARVHGALGALALAIEHVGSTAVRGLPGKPVLDLAVAVAAATDADACVLPLEALGYAYRGAHGEDPRRRYYVRDEGGQRVAQLHLYVLPARGWDEKLAFRDALRSDPALSAAYAAEKWRIAERVGWHKPAYAEAKAAFVEAVLATLRADAAGASSPGGAGHRPMYSMAWFDTFASTVPERTTEGEVAAITRLAPAGAFPRLLDLGCGTGRVAAPLASCGYDVTGIDTSIAALAAARRAAPAARLVALDQQHVGRMRWTFDVAVVLWNSFGFGSRAGDRETLRGLHRVVRTGGRLLLDLYHPEWLHAQAQIGAHDPRGATIDRWVEDGRCHHRIRYVDGSTDEIQFNVYAPDEICALLRESGFQPEQALVWWEASRAPAANYARYQIVSSRLLQPDPQ